MERSEVGCAYMELAAELAVGAELDVDALVEAEPDQIQRLLHRALFLARHLLLPLFLLPSSSSRLSVLCNCERPGPYKNFQLRKIKEFRFYL